MVMKKECGHRNAVALSGVLVTMPAKSNRENENEWLPYWAHAYDTAGIMVRLGERWMTNGMQARLFPEWTDTAIRRLFRFLGLVHDLGKLTPIFQHRILPCLPEIGARLGREGLSISREWDALALSKTTHAMASEALLLSYGCSTQLASIAGAHHGKPQAHDANPEMQPDCYEQNYFGAKGRNSEVGKIWDSLQREWFDHALTVSGYATGAALPEPSATQQVFLCGLLITADWLASNTAYFPLFDIDTTMMTAREYANRVDAAWEKVAFPDAWCAANYFGDADLFHERFGFPPNALQTAVMAAVNDQSEPGIMIIEAQMGVGKTEAALMAAEVLAAKFDCNGLFFGLPTQATANGIFSRQLDWADKSSEDTVLALRLAHGTAALNEDYRSLFHGTAATGEFEAGGLLVHPWFEGRKQALLANFVTGTVDQLLMMTLKHKHAMLRHLGLAGKVVIIDECHAYDAHMNTYLNCALRWLGAYGVPVILLSATLPVQRRHTLVQAYLGTKKPLRESANALSYPLITRTDGDALISTAISQDAAAYKVQIRKIDDDALLQTLQDRLREGGCAGVIVNTVRRAQQIARSLREALPDFDICLVHAGFTMADRSRLEKIIMGRIGRDSTPEDRNRLIVIGTQVLEQSLDIDFDVLVTDLCPMDLLLQRIGRLHRHHRERPNPVAEATCYVLGATEPFESGAVAIYGEWLLMLTAKQLPSRVALPEDIPILVQTVYADPDACFLQDPSAMAAWGKHLETIEIKKSEAKHFCMKKPENIRRGLNGWLDCDQTDISGEQSVRGGDPSIEVILLMNRGDGVVSAVSWQDRDETFKLTEALSKKEGRKILLQKIRLPRSLCVRYNIHKTIEVLNGIKAQYFQEWDQNPWLKNEWFLLLDAQGETELLQFELTYTKTEGLICMIPGSKDIEDDCACRQSHATD